MTTALIIEHIWISFVGCIVGFGAASALGVPIALGVRTLLQTFPALHKWLILVPWRTLVVNGVLIAWTPANILLFGFGSNAGIFGTGIVLFFSALPFIVSVLIERQYPLSSYRHTLAGIRTLIVASLVASTLVEFYNSGGFGWIMSRSLYALRYNDLFQEWLVLILLVLIADTIFGIIEIVLLSRLKNNVPLT